MPHVIVFGSSKGGCGKSTNAIALAVSLSQRGYRIACVDADPNAAFLNWHRAANRPGIEATAEIDEDAILPHIYHQAEHADVVIVDTGGWMNQTGVFSFGAASCVLIPVMPDRNSVIEARRTARKVESVSRIASRDIPYRVLLSRWTPKGLLEKATLNDLTEAGLPHVRQHMPNLTAFAKASFSGDMPHKGFIGLVVGKIIDELQEIGAIPTRPTRKAA